MLAALHQQALPEILPVAPQINYTIPAFDTDAMLVELGLMPEWYLPDRERRASGDTRAEFTAMWRESAEQGRSCRRKPGCCGTFIRPI